MAIVHKCFIWPCTGDVPKARQSAAQAVAGRRIPKAGHPVPCLDCRDKPERRRGVVAGVAVVVPTGNVPGTEDATALLECPARVAWKVGVPGRQVTRVTKPSRRACNGHPVFRVRENAPLFSIYVWRLASASIRLAAWAWLATCTSASSNSVSKSPTVCGAKVSSRSTRSRYSPSADRTTS